MFPEIRHDERTLLDRIMSAPASAVEAAVSRETATFDDFLTLLSPAAAPLVGTIRERAATLKRMNFGRTVRLYSPLYVSSHCVNDCLYCGFRRSNKADRKRLDLAGVMADAKVIKSWGVDSILLVSGEDPKAVSIDFLEKAVAALKSLFSYVSIEIYPLDEDGYRRLFLAGAHGLTIYQETYDAANYASLHPSGPKRDYSRRLAAIDSGARAGFYNIGIGALLGLYDWRSEAVSMAAHALWIRRKHWRSRNQFSFPRITPMEGGFQPPCPVSESDLEQMMLAFRIFFPQSDIFMSTRERHEFRMRSAATCASHLSAGSRVVPGSYAAENDASLGQFTVMDENSVANVSRCLLELGLEPVFKDWDPSLGAEPRAS